MTDDLAFGRCAVCGDVGVMFARYHAIGRVCDECAAELRRSKEQS